MGEVCTLTPFSGRGGGASERRTDFRFVSGRRSIRIVAEGLERRTVAIGVAPLAGADRRGENGLKQDDCGSQKTYDLKDK